MNLRFVTITFLLLLSCSNPILTASISSNQDMHNKITTIQSNQIRWNLSISYTITNDSTGTNFVVGTSLRFFQNIMVYKYVEPTLLFWITNSSSKIIFSRVTPQLTLANKSFSANQSITSSFSGPLTTSMISRTDNYTILVTMITINRTYSNPFSAIVTNSSIHIHFKNNVIIDTGLYNVTYNSISSITATITKSRSLSIDFIWFILAFVPLIIFSRRKRRII